MLSYFHKLATAGTAEARQRQISEQHAALRAHAPPLPTPQPKRKVGRPRKVHVVDAHQALADGVRALTLEADGEGTVSTHKRGPYNNWYS